MSDIPWSQKGGESRSCRTGGLCCLCHQIAVSHSQVISLGFCVPSLGSPSGDRGQESHLGGFLVCHPACVTSCSPPAVCQHLRLWSCGCLLPFVLRRHFGSRLWEKMKESIPGSRVWHVSLNRPCKSMRVQACLCTNSNDPGCAKSLSACTCTVFCVKIGFCRECQFFL